jgi:hypothetical protein
VLAATLVSCSDSTSPPAPNLDPTPDPADPGDPVEAGKAEALLGTWETSGVDAQLGGAVTVRLELRTGGVLRVSVTGDSGVALNFAGTWESTPTTLLLTGAYFRPDGRAQVGCQLSGDTLLVLQDSTGTTQDWRRLE